MNRELRKVVCAVAMFVGSASASAQQVWPEFEVLPECSATVHDAAIAAMEALDSDAFWQDATSLVGDGEILRISAERSADRRYVSIAELEQDVRGAVQRAPGDAAAPHFPDRFDIACQGSGGSTSRGRLDVGRAYAGEGPVSGFAFANLLNTMAHELLHIIETADGAMYVIDGRGGVRRRARRRGETSATYLVGAVASCRSLVDAGVYRAGSFAECVASLARSKSGAGYYAFYGHPLQDLVEDASSAQ